MAPVTSATSIAVPHVRALTRTPCRGWCFPPSPYRPILPQDPWIPQLLSQQNIPFLGALVRFLFQALIHCPFQALRPDQTSHSNHTNTLWASRVVAKTLVSGESIWLGAAELQGLRRTATGDSAVSTLYDLGDLRCPGRLLLLSKSKAAI